MGYKERARLSTIALIHVTRHVGLCSLGSFGTSFLLQGMDDGTLSTANEVCMRVLMTHMRNA